MRKINLLIILVAGTLLPACTEKIDIDFNAAEPQIVIEGNVQTEGIPAEIIITETVNFQAPNRFPKITGASVTISDNNGQFEVLKESSPGVYTSNTLNAEIGNTYSLRVETKDKVLTSSSYIPPQVKLDTVYIELEENGGGLGFGDNDEDVYTITVKYTDDGESTNYYRIVDYVNGKKGKSYIFDDITSNGNSVTRKLKDRNRTLIEGDTLRVVMECIDPVVYDYFVGLSKLSGRESSSPGNPYTNIEGSRLGYFSAHTTEERIILFSQE